MKTKFFTLAAAMFVISLLASACGPIHIHFDGVRHVEGSGNVITVTRNVADFEAVSLSGFGELNITQGDAVSLNVRTDDNIMPYVKTEVRNEVRKEIKGLSGLVIEGVVAELLRIRFDEMIAEQVAKHAGRTRP